MINEYEIFLINLLFVNLIHWINAVKEIAAKG